MSYAEQVLTESFKAEMERSASPHEVSFDTFDIGHEIGMCVQTKDGRRRAVRTDNGARVRSGQPSLTVAETQAALRNGMTEMIEFISAGYGGKAQRNS